MSKNKFLDRTWQNSFLEKIKGRAGSRYRPKLNIDLPISEIFDGISRNDNFYISIRKHFGKLNREFSRVTSRYDDKKIQKIYQTLKNKISLLSKPLYKIKGYSTNIIPWEEINQRAKEANAIGWNLSNKLSNEKAKVEQQKADDKREVRRLVSERLDYDIHYLYETEKELRYFEELSLSTKAKLSSFPFLLLTGIAGTGKTHLLCDIVENRVTGNKLLPSVLVFGELFATADDPFKQIISQLGLDLNKNQFLRLLNNAGRQSRCRAILAIDALNETKNRTLWKRHLNKVIDELKKYPNVALIISVRSGFEVEVLTKKHKNVFVHEEHRGFQFREWEAVSKFFQEFNLPLPEIPLLMPEFQNPLFLLLFCKAFHKRVKKQKQIFRGHEGATYIFEAFVDSVSKRIAKQFSIDNGARKNIWDTVIEKIAAEMADQNDVRISEDQVISIAESAYPSIDHSHFIKELERNLLLVKVPRYAIKKKAYDGFDFRFPFQKFSDHLIGRYLFKKYEKEFGKTNKNLETAIKFFSKRRKLGKFLSNSWNRGIVEALSIQCPEQLRGCELVDVAPYLKNSHVAREAFVESLIWRKPTAFSSDLKNTLAYINAENIRIESDHNSLLNAFLAVTPIPNHPFNADFLHKHLSKFSMAKRDSWWSTFLHYQYSEKGAVDRLIEWGWLEQDKTHIKDEAVRLCSVALLWFLTTSNRFVRDKSTKALVALLTDRLSVVLDLLKQFQDVNDPYVSERLYAVAYGCVLRNQKDKNFQKELAQWIYDTIFKNGKPPVHILLRDYAYGVIQTALHNGVKLKISLKKIKPPYVSDWPKKIPTEKKLKDKYYPKDVSKDRGYVDIWNSLMYNSGSFLADFGNYVLNPNLNRWSGKSLKTNTPSKKEIFKKFKQGFSSKQKKLWEMRNRYFKIDFKLQNKFIKSDKIELPDSIKNAEDYNNLEYEYKKERRKSEKLFKESLSTKQRKIYEKEIKPYLNNSGGINEPLENFDNAFAQRWVFNRVVKLGWKPKLHGEFDKDVNYYSASRTEHKSERIGKKYQWIAFHELLAYVSDNFEFKRGSWSENSTICKGPWQLSVRDIDPSCTLKDFQYYMPHNLPNIKKWQNKIRYNYWDKNIMEVNWLKKINDLPDPQKIIDVLDDNNKNWLILDGFIEWQEEIPPEQERYHYPQKRLWYMVKSYIVKNKDFKRVYNWAKKQNYFGRWMPESNEFSNIFLGEYPWAPAFLYYYSYHDEWIDETKYGEKMPIKVLITDDQYFSSGQSIDCSTSEGIRVKLPANWLISKMQINQTFVDGRFFDKNEELATFDPTVFDCKSPNMLLINKENFCRFLKSKGYSVFWTILGEKSIIGELFSQSDWKGSLEISGAYTLDSKNKIIGSMNTNYKNRN